MLFGIPALLLVCTLNVLADSFDWHWIGVLSKSAIVTTNIGFALSSMRIFLRGRRSEHYSEYAYYRRAVNFALIGFTVNAFVAIVTILLL
ncbi:hypothetical protein D3C84_1141660 [compost metagenome]